MNEQQNKSGLKKFVDKLANVLPILVIVFLGVGALSLTYYFFGGIIDSFRTYGSFDNVLGGIASGFSSLFRYVFYAAVTLGISKLINK